MDRKAYLTERYAAVKRAIPEGVELVAVSKMFPASDIQILYDLGHRSFGENYAQELLDKAATLPSDIRWHFIGGLQSNKIRPLLGLPSLFAIHTVDSIAKAEQIEKECAKLGRQIDIFVQVNVGREQQKHGVHPELVEPVAFHIIDNMCRCRFRGFMTIGSAAEADAAVAEGRDNQEYARLKEIADKISYKRGGINVDLSMGMSGDYAKAIEQGSNLVRVGSSIFGSRPAVAPTESKE